MVACPRPRPFARGKGSAGRRGVFQTGTKRMVCRLEGLPVRGGARGPVWRAGLTPSKTGLPRGGNYGASALWGSKTLPIMLEQAAHERQATGFDERPLPVSVARTIMGINEGGRKRARTTAGARWSGPAPVRRADARAAMALLPRAGGRWVWRRGRKATDRQNLPTLKSSARLGGMSCRAPEKRAAGQTAMRVKAGPQNRGERTLPAGLWRCPPGFRHGRDAQCSRRPDDERWQTGANGATKRANAGHVIRNFAASIAPTSLEIMPKA